MNNICVIGSMNIDVVLNVKRMVRLGETMFANSLKNIPGGKGANQAVACSRMGAKVYMISKVGMDGNGEVLIKELVKDNINVDYVFKDNNEATGTAIITVDEYANNSIIVASGANMAISKEEINKSSEAIEKSEVIISQFEVPMEAIIEGFKIAKKNNRVTILNPAPAKEVPEELLKYTDIIIPNETEAFELTGIEVSNLENAKIAAKKLLEKGVKYVIITLGSKGAALINNENAEIIPAFKVKAIDTTAAGDSFIGGLASKLNIKNLSFENVKNAVLFGNKVSSITVQREGAQPSIPTLEEVKRVYGEE
ncbi:MULTISPECIES: ribokinase [Clostridium]|uniref:Ribokinase n=2 Tax=Clostridium TaxID=1485 RepID=A0A151AN29_9CLOT|nr:MULTISPECIES: ribokinase [Clostridium]KYH29033.1 ribokinase [Clostridium colicanis DSM 13634]MBE6043404.1 ribokinase [Clostridium thermopalmarium]PRR73662.1 Ribokinase [Clostridium thermopalmarium DSM 5974]PVZ21048.1 ribokinase [Clostridium thermopalmarium DSM 5974]